MDTDIDQWDEAERVAMARSASPHVWVNPHAGVTCDSGACQWCEGGLEVCSQCDAFEGATPTECPKRRMAYDEADAVYAGELDFRQGAWQARTTRWLETSRAWQDHHAPEPLVLTGLPPIVHARSGLDVGHTATYDPQTQTSWCAPDCQACAYVLRRATEGR